MQKLRVLSQPPYQAHRVLNHTTLQRIIGFRDMFMQHKKYKVIICSEI